MTKYAYVQDTPIDDGTTFIFVYDTDEKSEDVGGIDIEFLQIYDADGNLLHHVNDPDISIDAQRDMLSDLRGYIEDGEQGRLGDIIEFED